MAGDGGLQQRLGWYVRRLRSMERGEFFWRVGQVLEKIRPDFPNPAVLGPGAAGWDQALERFRKAENRPILLDRRRADQIAQRQPKRVAELIRAADRSAEYTFSLLGYPAAQLAQPIDWHHDPFANLRWPDVPSHRIDHRVAGGDVKWIWELNRLQHLPWLAQAWLFTRDSRYSRAAFEHLDTWIEQNPPKRGIAWRGAFEAGLRAISISIALQGLRDSPELTAERYRRIVGVLAESADRCWRERSLFSSANNHLIGEMAGLAVVAMAVPELRSSSRWERHAIATLCEHAGRQILPDGTGSEQSVGYQIATVELLHLVASLLQERDGAAPKFITDAVARSGVFLGAVVGRDDPDPRYGDADQEFAVRLGPESVRTVRDHLEIISADRMKSDAVVGGLSAEWFRYTTSGSTNESANSPREQSSFFASDGGLVVLRHGRRRITMDVGNLGYLSIAAHGHADALAVTLSADGAEVISDPGTGSYYQHPRWREVMRGTRAHATVCVDGENQSVIGGPFMWSRHARVRVHGVDLQAGIVDAAHDGYSRLAGKVIHRRWLVAPPADRCLLIIDLIDGVGLHQVSTCWPIHPSLSSQRIDGGHLLKRDRPVFQVLHSATTALAFDDAYGDEERDLGWWSDRLERRVPAWWLSAGCSTDIPVVLATLVSPIDGILTADLVVASRGAVIDVSWSEDSRKRSAAVRVDRPATISLQ